MEAKKISFGFTKSNKKLGFIVKSAALNQEANKIELIKCLEGQEIKLVEEKPEEAPIVIPLEVSQKTSAALASLVKRRAVLLGEDEPMELNTTAAEIAEDTNSVINATDDIEKRAALELLADLKASSTENPTTNLVLPVVHPDDLPLEGAKEPSLDDYDNIPIEQFGKAMLRGMGWVEPPTKATKGVAPLDDSPMVRPKGMGLGADKALKAKPLLVAPESNEVLEIKRNAFVRILGGKHKDLYGQIEGFDDHAGRVIVKMAIGGIKESFNEFLCQPISRKEFAQYGKCINSTKYEEFKKQQNEYGQIILKKEETASSVDKRSIKLEKIKNETQLISSDDECKKVERKPIKKEETTSSGSRKRNYDDINMKSERDFKSEFRREEERDRFTKREKTKDYELDRKMDRYDRRNKEDRRSKERGDSDHMDRHRDVTNDCFKHSRPSKRESNRDASRDRRESKYDTESVERRKHTKKYIAKEEQQRDCGERKRRQDNTHSSESSNNDDKNKHRKSSKDKKFQKKSKKSKKRKSSRQDSDTESSALSAPNSSNTEQQRRSKHKKKTKKSKKERERSRSRGRR